MIGPLHLNYAAGPFAWPARADSTRRSFGDGAGACVSIRALDAEV